MENRAKKIAITDRAFFSIMAKLVRVKNSTTDTLFARWAAPSATYLRGEGVKGIIFKVAKCLENFKRTPDEKRHITVRFCSNKRRGSDDYEFVLHFDMEDFKFEGNTPQLNHVTILKMNFYSEWELAFHLKKTWNRIDGNDNVKKIVHLFSISQDVVNSLTIEDAQRVAKVGSEIAIVFHGAKARNVTFYNAARETANDITMKKFHNTSSIFDDCHTLPL